MNPSTKNIFLQKQFVKIASKILRPTHYLRYWNDKELFSSQSMSVSEKEERQFYYLNQKAPIICEWIRKNPTPWLQNEKTLDAMFFGSTLYREVFSELFYTHDHVRQSIIKIFRASLQNPEYIQRYQTDNRWAKPSKDIEKECIRAYLQEQHALSEKDKKTWIKKQWHIAKIWTVVQEHRDESVFDTWFQIYSDPDVQDAIVGCLVGFYADNCSNTPDIQSLYDISEYNVLLSPEEMLLSVVGHMLNMRFAYNQSHAVAEKKLIEDVFRQHTALLPTYTKEQYRNIQWAFAWLGLSMDEKESNPVKHASPVEQMLYFTQLHLTSRHEQLQECLKDAKQEVVLIEQFGLLQRTMKAPLTLEKLIQLGELYENMIAVEHPVHIEPLDLTST